MANIKFFYNNLIKTYTPTETSQHENFPVENLQHRDFNKAWRSQHGAGSGWGNFLINDGIAIATMAFDSGSVEPQVGEKLTGATSSAEAYVISVTLSTGTWGGGTAAGTISLTECSGRFHDNETITGDIGGANILTVNEPDSGAGVDLVQNGDFSVDTDPPPGWTGYYGNETLTTEAGGKVGNCLMITATAGGNAGCRQNISVTVGKIYRLSLYIKAGTEATYQVMVYDVDNAAYIWQSGDLEEGAGDWSTQASHIFEAPAGCSSVRIILRQVAGGAGTTIYFDENSLYELEDGSVNNKIDFEETVATELTATLTAGEYTADELATEIETQLEVDGASDYTITYSDSTNKFTLASDRAGGGGTFKLLWNTGTNVTASVGDTIGFDVSADDNDAASHTADYVRIHSEERAVVDLTAATDICGIIIRGLNFSISAVVDAIFSANGWATIAEHPDFTVQDDIMILQYDTPKNYQHAGIRIIDPENSDLYIKAGVLFIGPQFQPVTNNLQGPDLEDIDPSIIIESGAGQESSLQEDQYEIGTYVFRVNGAAEVANFKAMRDAVGTSKALFVCEDPTSDATARVTTKYIRFTSWKWTPLKQSVNRWQLVLGYKEQR